SESGVRRPTPSAHPQQLHASAGLVLAGEPVEADLVEARDVLRGRRKHAEVRLLDRGARGHAAIQADTRARIEQAKGFRIGHAEILQVEDARIRLAIAHEYPAPAPRAARWIRSKRRAGEFQFPDLHFAIASLAYQPGLRVGRSVERELEPRSGFRERPISARVER